METALEFDKCLSVAVQTLEYERQQVILEDTELLEVIFVPFCEIFQVYSVHRWLNHHTPPLYWWFPVRTKPETHNSR
ncbi:hypothetical protein M514_13115 [Trichuris suis]|uniref:Uncharacterized protein n=1 Tax=Trichuris suis TaxID=68888 RepID=A0A085MVL0_9BILA|nr:hypothetical protein M514_13115 [Trichuris suis]